MNRVQQECERVMSTNPINVPDPLETKRHAARIIESSISRGKTDPSDWTFSFRLAEELYNKGMLQLPT